MVNNNEDSLAISGRFFSALDYLIENGTIRGLGTFTRTNNLNYGNFFSMRKNQSTTILKPEFMMYLCRDYNINPEWLLMGTGEMFKKETTINVSSVDIKHLIDTLNESLAINKRLADKLEHINCNTNT